MTVLLLCAGLAILIFGGDLLVKGASGLALKFSMPPMLVGMTVVAFGTSAPELVVSVQAALSGRSDIAIGNVIGSNIANVALILGLTVIIFPISIKKDSLHIDWVAMMLASLLFYFFLTDLLISRLEGIILFSSLIGFITLSIIRLKRSKLAPLDGITDGSASRASWILIGMVLIGSVGLVLGAKWFLEGAETIARNFGVSDRIIAVTLVAFGTSVPELAASVIAAFKKEQDISLGNIIGSNLFNILSILGITAMIQPIPISTEVMGSDIFWMLATSFVILPLSFYRLRLGRMSGSILLLLYFGFMYFTLSTL